MEIIKIFLMLPEESLKRVSHPLFCKKMWYDFDSGRRKDDEDEKEMYGYSACCSGFVGQSAWLWREGKGRRQGQCTFR